jgi:cobalt/nickel transport system permease protein
MWTSLDPRARLMIVLFATVLVASTPRGELRPFALFFPLILGGIVLLRPKVSWRYLLARCVACSPFILMASVLLLFQYDLTPDGRPEGAGPAATVACKGYSAALLLAFLTESTPLGEILWAMRKLGSPETLNLILSLMYRYTALLEEEWVRLERARDSRTVRPLGWTRLTGVYGRQVGTLLVRSWERAERVHAAMLARGFHGAWPMWRDPKFRWSDGASIAGAVGAFGFARFFNL